MIPFGKNFRTACLLSILYLFVNCSDQNHKIKLHNPAGSYLKNNVVVLPRTDIEQVTGKIKSHEYFKLSNGFRQLPVQFDDIDGDGIWDEMALSVSLKPNQTKVISLKRNSVSKNDEFNSATWVHLGVKPSEKKPSQSFRMYTLKGDDLPWDDNYYPFQMDGPAWENDKVGFRLYLDGRNAKDIFAKRVPDLILKQIGLDSLGNPVDNYHSLEYWGRDVLQVGNSLGAGGLAMLRQDSLYRLGIIKGALKDVIDSTHFRIINTGPVRAIFVLRYYGWQVQNHKYNLEEIISLNQGEYCYHSTVRIPENVENIRLVTGMANLDNNNPLQIKDINDKLVLFSHDKQTYNKEYYLGMALSVQKKNGTKYNQATGSGPDIVSSYYISSPSMPDNQMHYSFYACCELSDIRFRDSNRFVEFIENEINKPKIEIHFIN